MSIILTKEQLNQIDVIDSRIRARERVSVFSGYAGTGKTTSLRYFIPTLGYREEEIALAAFTGTAAKNITIGQQKGQTLHSLIYNAIMKRGVCVGFRVKPYEDLMHLKLVVIDEHSMVPQEMLIDLMHYNIPILLVGDKGQLQPIGDPHMYFNTSHANLTEVHRQALNNPVLKAATDIREGNPVPDGNYDNVLLVGKKLDLNPDWLRQDVQFIVGTNNTRLDINNRIAGPKPFVGSKIMFLKNDKNGITNGTFAEVIKLKGSYGSYKLDVLTDDGMVIRDYWADFNFQKIKSNQYFCLAYAITTHKSQGATFNSRGVILDEAGAFKGQEKEIRYTALTRFTGNFPVAWLR